MRTPRFRLAQVGERSAWLDALRVRIFPDRWSSLFGQISLYSFVAVLLSGVVLMFFYDPSATVVSYDGSYGPLHGVRMSKALESTLHISFDVQGGMLVRQLHHWAALVMMAALMLLLLRLFFVGAYRKPREKTWLTIVTLLLVAMGIGLTGSALPDDLLSGSSMAILDGVLAATPLVGPLASRLLFGGPFPGDVNAVLYPAHIGLSVVAIGLFALLIRQAVKRRHVVAASWRRLTAKRVGTFFATLGVLVLMAGTLTINPIWLFGPADPASSTAGASPSWYLAVLDGALRLAPGWEVEWLGRTWSVAILAPLAVITLFFAVLALYPYLERLFTKDRKEHLEVERFRDNPRRSGIGVAGMAFYGVLWAAAGSNTLAPAFGVTVEGMMFAFQLLLVVGPVVGFLVTQYVCLGLLRREQDDALHGYETGIIIRSPEGGYTEVHAPVERKPELVGTKVRELSGRP
ncbi:cytochrome b [Tenggerimyces flavus]|uniref:Cytochrome bc1 complex cytochrome b subunit n=1 Tax=Tenggerimyces flavus TaxID=1708749 RepID=A0ABV7YF59_9ACTN|nr:cytochrome b N-terminal domain-containing protein [Tenggerimyces flavus]MBM7786066.1 ubiquinol-cytochrome c reductase cytochrome b subunit [Tenggerimyces flavus]